MAILHEIGPGGQGGRSTRALSIQCLLDIRGMTAIDLGSKEGYNSFDLHECGATNVLGIEIRDNFLTQARNEGEALRYRKVEFRKADVRIIDELGLGKFDLCLCSGLLYHMQNPFNLLKRLRNICTHLAIETHVAPSFFELPFVAPKYRCHLDLVPRRLELDGVAFRGRVNTFPAEQDMQATSGSVVSHSTFWLFHGELLRALDAAGFDVMASYHRKIPDGKPRILVDHGVRRSKVFLLAKNRTPGHFVPVADSRIVGCKRLKRP